MPHFFKNKPAEDYYNGNVSRGADASRVERVPFVAVLAEPFVFLSSSRGDQPHSGQRMRGSEGSWVCSSVSRLRTLNTAQITYNSAYLRFADSLAKLGGTNCKQPTAAEACLIDTQLAKGTKNGYKFTVSASASAYQVFAIPRSGEGRHFCSFEDAMVRASWGAITVCNDTVSPLE